MTTDADNVCAKKRRSKRPLHGLPSVQRSLADWIRDATNDRPPEDNRKGDLVHVYSEHAKQFLPSLKTPTVTIADGQSSTIERIKNQLEMLWADVEFWKLVYYSDKPPTEKEIAECAQRAEKKTASSGDMRRQGGTRVQPTKEVALWSLISSHGADGVQLKWYIESAHGVSTPEFAPHLWKRLVSAKVQRATLFEVLCKQEWRWLQDKATLTTERVKGELVAKGFSRLVEEYFQSSRVELTRALASREFTGDALKAIKAMALRLADDADWCSRNLGIIPPPEVRKPVGGQLSLEHVRIVEELVRLFDETPQASNGQIAKTYCDRAKLKGRTVHQESIRVLAATARKLARFRDGIIR